MPRKKSSSLLTDREMDVMKILWSSNEPLVASEISKRGDSLSNNTVQSVLRKLLDKNYIVVADIVYSGTVLTRSYKPIVLKKDLLLEQFVSQFNKDDDMITIPNLVGTLLKHEKNEKETIEKLEKLLEERKNLLNQEEK
ncbi:BlaI/MecI/CopY family transcriptional regulator [Lacrimispora algidixylanolytica]|uniref:Penicillinase repressor n=1 Tax=Lacrimispora algidixylanolytica TaxID=94868 RepID=A0A419TBY8_9FIRM|nr:BlaI/MecI/CopY family transcriptional regulator [Lacrimispora algidixylanolytica]RKD34983.1 penicillinase repressor [Lacrimispora algidixylanolytica]